jgi:hypothetical protein
MTLSLEAIFRPLNDFFVNNFGPARDAPILFRFARIPRGFVDADFAAPLQPESGPSLAVTRELLSSVVDGIPRLDPDGRTVWLQTSQFSELYRDEMVGPSIPSQLGEDIDSQARTDAFNAAKASALALWEGAKAASVIDGPGVWVRLSTGTPAQWWDKSDKAVWVSRTFQVQGASVAPAPPGSTPDQLLRMKTKDEVLRPLLLAQAARFTASSAPARAATPSLNKAPSGATKQLAQPLISAVLSRESASGVTASRVTAVRAPATWTVDPSILVTPAPNVGLHDDLWFQLQSVPARHRWEIQGALAEAAPTQSVSTPNVSISFDYCVVNIERPWLHAAFLDDPSWRVPGRARGALSANDGHGVPALVVGFVAVKQLRIQAPWTPEDVSNLGQSVQFGPFNCDSQVVNGAISHDGIQIIGWLLQDLSELPPQGDVA